MIPTSNHNPAHVRISVRWLFISWFLHQTTTTHTITSPCKRCLSLDSYIKPQLWSTTYFRSFSCLSLDSYIKPQPTLVTHRQVGVVYLLIPTSNHNSIASIIMLAAVVYLLIPTSNHNPRIELVELEGVVYLLIPTSNHNLRLLQTFRKALFISWFLHQTTTFNELVSNLSKLFISWFLHQTTTPLASLFVKPVLFISWFLHQTTTWRKTMTYFSCCLSLDSYIKPQLCSYSDLYHTVVYLLIPTSNHN